MKVHKLTAGDGYSYLTRQVAAMDATDKGHTGLGDYYAQKGSRPGSGRARAWRVWRACRLASRCPRSR